MHSTYLLLTLMCSLSMAKAVSNIACTIQEDATLSEYGLSENAAAAIRHKGDNTREKFQAFHCTCPLPADIGYLEDSKEVAEFNDNDNLTKRDSFDWKDSSVFYIHDCDDLVINFGRNTVSFARALDGAALIFENIKLMQVDGMDAARTGQLANGEGTFSSLHFRNVLFQKLPNTFYVDDKAELSFHTIRMMEDVGLNLAINNVNNAIDPVLHLENCEFPAPKDVSKGIATADVHLIISAVNDQRKVGGSGDDEPCELDYKGTVVIKGCSIGALDSESIEIEGAAKIEFVDNSVEVVMTDSIILKNVKEVDISMNKFRFPLSLPAVNMQYMKDDTNSCSEPDLPFSSIKTINFKGNHFPHMTESLFTATIDGYTTEEDVLGKMSFVNNSAEAMCDCDTQEPEEYEEVTVVTADQVMHMNMIESSHCLAKVDDLYLPGLRKDICNGKLPETPVQTHERLQEDVRSQWTIYVILAALLSAIAGAIAAAVGIKMCCDSKSGEVTPRA